MAPFDEKHPVVHEEGRVKETLDEASAGKIAEERDHIADDADADGLKRELETSHQSGYAATSAEERSQQLALNRKLDIYLLPFCVLIYLFNGLDRSNLGNAQTNGFTKDLGIRPDAVNTATSLFFATYVPLQPVSAAIGKRVGQPLFLGIIGIGWGVLTLCHAFVKNEAQLIAIRLLIGVTESGFYPTVVSYLSHFYPRYDLAFRIAIFYGAYAIAGAFGGIIAYGCFHIDGRLHGWQYLFLIEGAGTMLIGLVTPFWLAKTPGSAWFLSERQKRYAENRMVVDSAANLDSAKRLTSKDVKWGVLDWKLWFVEPFNVLASTAPQGFTIFFPLVVKGLGYSGAKANLMTVPPYVIGTIVLLIFAYASDHFRSRVFPILGGLAIVLIGLITVIALPLSNTGGRYAGLCILLAGTFISSPITVAWLSGNTPEPGMRTIVLGINGYGNLGGIIGSELFLSRYGPDYHYPLKVTAGLIAVSMLGYAAYGATLVVVNKWKARKLRGMSVEEIQAEKVGEKRYADKKWTFVYGF